MVSISISNPDKLKILDESERKAYYGCDQNWYNTQRQRFAGCGPSVASNLMLYLYDSKGDTWPKRCCNSRETCLSLMEEMWMYVTPAEKGIPSAELFCEDLLAYAKAKGMEVEYHFCDLPQDKSKRPGLSEVIKFIDSALAKDVPVAFLNLCNGEEKNLDVWHWVTVISLEHEEDGECAFVDILDVGAVSRIDLALWYNTTKLGGGFAYFSKINYAL